MVDPYGYSIGISRAGVCQPATTTGEQKPSYGLAYDQVHYGMALPKVGLTFRELVERSSRIPQRFEELKRGCTVHSIGMREE